MAKHVRRPTHISSKKPSLASLKPRGVSPLALGLVAAGVGGAALLIARHANAATPGPDSGTLVPTPVPNPPPAVVPVNPNPPPAGTPSTNLIAGQTATVAVTALNFRADATTNSAVLGQFNPGDVVLVLDASRADGWVRIQTAAGTVGFVCNTCGLSGLTATHPGLTPGGTIQGAQPTQVASATSTGSDGLDSALQSLLSV